MNVEILQEANDELDAAVAYYEDIEAGLGIRLKEAVTSLMPLSLLEFGIS